MLSAVGNPVTVRVPAKINLHLAVGPTRPDGYHDLVTVFQALDVVDEVTVLPTVGGRPTPGVELLDAGPATVGVPVDTTNLAWRAVEALAAHAGREPEVRVQLRKAIPVAGGMAGGSADAAGALLGLCTLWRLDLGRQALMEIAGGVGSDVAFALHGGTALGTGRGEQLVPVLGRHTFHWVVALQDHGLSTPAVFGELDRLREERGTTGGAHRAPTSSSTSASSTSATATSATATSAAATSADPPDRLGAVEPVLEAVASGEPHALALLLGNDLQAAAVSLDPGLRRTLRAGVDAGALAGIVSGSGPTCVFLCADGPAAVRVAAELAGVGVCRTVRVAHGPVPGARVVDPGPTPPPTGRRSPHSPDGAPPPSYA